MILGLAIIGLIQDDGGHWRNLSVAFWERPILLSLGYFIAPIALMLAISLLQSLLVTRHVSGNGPGVPEWSPASMGGVARSVGQLGASGHTAPLATHFKSVRSESLFRARVSLYERCEPGTQPAGGDR